MKKVVFTILSMAALALVANTAMADDDDHNHGDIHVELHGNHLEIEFPTAGMRVFEAEFPTTGLSARITDAPGFASDEGVFPQGTGFGYNVLGSLYYWDGTEFASPGAASITIKNKLSAPDTIVSASSGIQLASFTNPLANIIGVANTLNELHTHVDFELSADAPTGAYGLIFSLSTDMEGIGDSDVFGIFFNYGLDHEAYELGVDAFNAVVIPEPATGAVAGVVSLLALAGLRRRRRRHAKTLAT